MVGETDASEQSKSTVEQYVENMKGWIFDLIGEVVSDTLLKTVYPRNDKRMNSLRTQIWTLGKIKALHHQSVDQRILVYLQKLPDPIAFFPKLLISLRMGIRSMFLDRKVPVPPKELEPGVLKVLKTIQRHQKSLLRRCWIMLMSC